MRVIVTGLIAQHRGLGGVAWDYLNVLLGLRDLGHDVFYIEDSGEWPYNPEGGPNGDEWVARDCTPNVHCLADVMSQFGLADNWAYRFPLGSQWFGLADSRRREVVTSADLLLNVSGTLEHPEEYRDVERLAYLDTDPVFTQIQIAAGNVNLQRRVNLHDVHFSVGERLGESVPSTGHHWQPTKHPIVLREWRASVGPRDVFTTVMNWTSYQPIEFGGRRYGQKDVEFRRFLPLPRLLGGASLEVAMSRTYHLRWETQEVELPSAVAEFLAQHPGCTPQDLLRHHGWRVVDATEVCGDFRRYRGYVQASKAEWSVAKNGYVSGRCGWFSGRSACYLAAGRPVVVQDTGFEGVLPLGEGILSFRSSEEAVAGCREVLANYERHSRAAFEIAAEYFDAGKVLTRILELSSPSSAGA